MSRSRPRVLPLDFRTAAFVAGSLAILAACFAVVRTGAVAQAPDVVWFGITFDLCISIPLLYLVFVVRGGHASLVTVVPLFVLTLLAARAVVPAGHRDFLQQLSLLQLPLAAIAALVLLRKGTFRDSVAGRIVVNEVESLRLGLLGWRIASPPRRGVAMTTFHQRAGWGTVVAGFVLLIAVESVAVHLFVQQWSVTAAWIITGLDLWGAIWLIGDYHAFRTRPLVVTEDAVELRFGFRWSATIPRSNVAAVEEFSESRRTASYLRLSILEEPEYLLLLHEPVRVQGLAGITKTVTSIGLRVDDDAVIDALKR